MYKYLIGQSFLAMDWLASALNCDFPLLSGKFCTAGWPGGL
jgi:hypothetical protein